MASLRILLNSALVMVLVFVAGILIGPRLQHPPLPLSIPNGHREPAAPIDHFAEPDAPTNNATPKPLAVNAPQPLKGIDLSGHLHRLGESENCHGIVLVFLGTQCPIANATLPRLQRLAEECSRLHVEFYAVLSSPTLTRRAALEHSHEYGIQFPVLFDVTFELRDRLHATHTPQAFVLTHSGEVRYRGAIDDQFVAAAGRRRDQPTQHWLRDAIRAVANNEPLTVAETEPVGCLMEPVQAASSILTFAREIAPIVLANCGSCHREGAVAPFALATYDDVKRHSAQIQLMVELRQMPPWRPVHGFGEFRDHQALTDREITCLTEWINASMPLGNLDDLPAARTLTDGWQLGRPDVELTISEAYAVPADGPDIYHYSVLPTELPEHRLVSAIEYRAGNSRVVHHASFRYDDEGQAKRLDAATPERGYQRFGGWGFESGGTLGGWAMGAMPQRFPSGLGRPLRAGSDFILQTHYHPTGKPELDQAKIGIYFAPPTAHRQVAELIVANKQLRIPPHERRFIHRAHYQLPVAVTMYAVVPHTHLLGRETKAVAQLPDGRVEPLIWIDDWHFNWQGHYFFKRPLKLPAGTQIEFEVVFDNSVANPLNPHSVPQWVHWGEETTQEMAVCFFDVEAQDPQQHEFLVAHNRQSLK